MLLYTAIVNQKKHAAITVNLIGLDNEELDVSLNFRAISFEITLDVHSDNKLIIPLNLKAPSLILHKVMAI